MFIGYTDFVLECNNSFVAVNAKSLSNFKHNNCGAL